jgi:hypothetical protein
MSGLAALDEIAPVSFREVADCIPFSEAVVESPRIKPHGFCVNPACVRNCNDHGRIHIVRCNGLGVISLTAATMCAKCGHALFWTSRHVAIRTAEPAKVRLAASRSGIPTYAQWTGLEDIAE